MKNRVQSSGGFSLIEAIVAMSLMIMVVVAAVNGWQYVVRGERLNSVQNELDIDVRNTMERLRNDLRLSSMDHIFVYPQGVGTNTAISFPKARPDPNTGLVALNTNTGLIEWDLTVIYHVWVSTPNELRLTLFDPRNPDLNDAQRQQQLEDVVQAGSGASTFNGGNASTRALFKNLFTWDIRGRGAQFDCYSPTLERMRNVMFGTALLNPGNHTFQFTAIGKNPSSSGYRMGLDTLVPGPSGLEREAEDQQISAQIGGSAFVEYMGQGAWSGNNQLAFDAVAPGSKVELTMENDRWEETNFRGTGALCEDAVVVFDEDAVPKDFVVTVHGETNGWLAAMQTKSSVQSTGLDSMSGTAIRMPIRGGQMYDGGAIEYSGPLKGVVFRAGNPGSGFRIRSAFIAEAADPAAYSPDAVDNGIQLFFGGSTDVNIPSNLSATGTPASAFYISPEKTYLVSVWVSSLANWANPAYWLEMTPPNSNGTPVGCYMIPSVSNPDATRTRQAIWSSDADVTTMQHLYSVESIVVLAPTSAVYTSQAVDTGQDAPAYQDIAWTAVKPAGTDVRLKVRTGDQADMSDAPGWTNVAAILTPGGINPGNKRYVQFQAILTPNNAGTAVPKLKDVTIRWTGITRLTDVGGTITIGPDYGIMEVTVNNKPLIKGMTVDLTIYKDVAGFGGVGSNRLTSTITAEVEPRNTGK